MEPIISPWLFYFVHVASAIQFTLILVGVVGILGSGFFFIGAHDPVDDIDDERDIVLAKKFFKVAVVAIILAIIIPNESTLYKMIAASLVTPDNISIVENGTVEFIERLAEAIAKNIK